YFFLMIGIITLLIALVNYVNLATARALDRAREVGVRKVVGAHQRQLIAQFMMESCLMNGIALLLAVGLSLALRPVLNQLANVHLVSAMWLQSDFWLVVLGIFAVGTLLSGVYPAFMLSSFKPVTVLKGGAGTLASRATLRKSLVVIQFVASIVLLAGTAVVYQQLAFMRSMDMGFELDQVLVVERPRVRGEVEQWATEMNTFKDKLRTIPAVGHVGLSSTTPGRGFDWYSRVFKRTDDPSQGKAARATRIDYDFLEVYGLQVVAGAPFREGMSLSDGEDAQVLVNEKLVRAVGFASNEEAIGQEIRVQRGDTYIIHGVVSDFKWSSAHVWGESVLMLYETRYGDISMTVQPEQIPSTLAAVREVFQTLFPGNPFVYRFADESFNAQYRADQRFATLFAIFAGIAILIACLGLFGLAAFTADRRTKEIGVRKVLGASVGSIVALLSQDFLKLVGFAFLFAVPLTYVLMQRWLEGFAYRISQGPGVFVLTGGLVLLIALATVSYQSIKAALADPVKSLRYE
ncbi:MAG TPA: FtsX-like permease family protein, partial [Rhodothermales bacterium]|nr:FtsX-like permease family protein [Rhodothermales bacterium]